MALPPRNLGRRYGMTAAIISSSCRIRLPDFFRAGSHSIVDDFCYFSTKVEIGSGSHIASGCSVAGGPERIFRMGDFSSLSSGVKIWCSSNDFVSDVVAIVPEAAEPLDVRPISGDVTLEHYTGVGANSVIMPDNVVPVGTTIGAMSFVPPGFSFEPWSVYAGIPVRRVANRDKERVLKQVTLLRRRLGLGEG